MENLFWFPLGFQHLHHLESLGSERLYCLLEFDRRCAYYEEPTDTQLLQYEEPVEVLRTSVMNEL